MKCSECYARKACQHTFSFLWNEKSHGGVGCDVPFTPEHAKAVEEFIYAKEREKTIEQSLMEF